MLPPLWKIYSFVISKPQRTPAAQHFREATTKRAIKDAELFAIKSSHASSERVVRMINRDPLDLRSAPKVIFVLHHFFLIWEGCLYDAKHQIRSSLETRRWSFSRRTRNLSCVALDMPWRFFHFSTFFSSFLSLLAIHNGAKRAENFSSSQQRKSIARKSRRCRQEELRWVASARGAIW